MNQYSPLFEITPTITDYLVKIGVQIGRLESLAHGKIPPYLRRSNRIRTIQASLAIEQNTLSLEQVTDVIEGRRVQGSVNEIQEVKNAFSAYELIEEYTAHSPENLLKAHKILMNSLIDSAGKWRSGGVGIVKGRDVIHMAPPSEKVPHLVQDLFGWLKKTDTHPLVSSSVVHYELEFIHPFSDGNGRIGRLWQTVILAHWNSIFSWLPIETIIRNHQQEYYTTLSLCDKEGNSTRFIEFMLQRILEACGGVGGGEGGGVKNLANQIVNLLSSSDQKLKANTIADLLNCSKRSVERALASLKKEGRVRYVGSPRYGHYEIVE